MKDWYGLAIRRFNDGNLIVCKISWTSDTKPPFNNIKTDYETVDFIVLKDKNQMEKVYNDATINFYRKNKCLQSIPCQNAKSNTISVEKIKLAEKYECYTNEIHAIALINDTEYPEIIDNKETDFNQGFHIGDTVTVRKTVGYAPTTGIITGFSNNQYGIRCADIKIFGHSTEKHALTSLSYPEKDYSVTIGFAGEIIISTKATSIKEASEKAKIKFGETSLTEAEIKKWGVEKIEDENNNVTYF